MPSLTHFSGSQPGNEFIPAYSRPENDFPAPAVAAELSNKTAGGYMPPNYSDVIDLEHLNPGANDGQIDHDHMLNGFSSNNVVVGSGNPISRGDHNGTERDTCTPANMSTNLLSGVQYAEDETPAPPSYNDALSGLYEAVASDAEH